jgi:hypothetical protein
MNEPQNMIQELEQEIQETTARIIIRKIDIQKAKDEISYLEQKQRLASKQLLKLSQNA